MRQIDCPINFEKLTKDYDTSDLTILYTDENRKGFRGVYYNRKGRQVFKNGRGYNSPFITLNIGQNTYPYQTIDRYKVALTAATKEELILFLFWHEFQHYLDGKTGIKTKHREVSEIAYAKVWGNAQ